MATVGGVILGGDAARQGKHQGNQDQAGVQDGTKVVEQAHPLKLWPFRRVGKPRAGTAFPRPHDQGEIPGMPDLAAFRFAEQPTATPLHPWFLTWWEFRVGDGAPSSHHVPPDGCTNLVLINQGTPREMLVAMGPFLAPRVVPAVPGMRTTGLRLHPAAAPALLGTGAAQLANQLIPVAQLAAVAPAALAEVLRRPTLDEVAIAGNALLLPLREQLAPTDPIASTALHQIWRTDGRTPLPAIAATLGCSPRTMLRRVRAASGLTPKQYARIIRFHSAVRGMVNHDVRLSHLAAQGGYADQPHFHHEVTALTGLTPAQLAERVRKTEHRLSREK